LILAPGTELFMSAASWWELGLKRALGKLDADLPAIRGTLALRGVSTISVTVEHGEAAAALAVVHRDRSITCSSRKRRPKGCGC
jgi:PIN domain nuclease of toxin-antitoxin system